MNEKLQDESGILGAFRAFLTPLGALGTQLVVPKKALDNL